MIELTPWQQSLCTAVSQQRVSTVAKDLRCYYEILPLWKWVRRIRVRHQLRIVTVVQDAYQMGWQDGAAGKRWS